MQAIHTEETMTELFDIQESKSPRLLWMDKHGIYTMKYTLNETGKPWNAEAAGYVCSGETEDDAIFSLAEKLQLRLWNEA